MKERRERVYESQMYDGKGANMREKNSDLEYKNKTAVREAMTVHQSGNID